MAERMYDPLAPIFDSQRIADSYQQDANVNFDKRVARESMPITRMIDPKGRLNKASIGNATPYTDASQMWEELNANMPSGRGIDPVVFQEKYQAGKQLYDMNWANQINQLRQSGMSERRISNNFDNNLEMKQYLIENGLIQPTSAKLDYGLGGLIKSTAIGTGTYSGLRAIQLGNTVPNPSKEQLQALKSKGFRWDKASKSIKRLSAKEILSQAKALPATDAEILRGAKSLPATKRLPAPRGLPGAGTGKPTTAAQDYIKNQRKKILDDVLKGRDPKDLGRFGNQAIKRGSKGFMGKLATNRALQAALGGGNLLTKAFAGGRMGAVAGGPWGAIIGSIALPMVGGYVWDQIKESQPTSDKTSIWK